ncbi:MAG: ferritin-like domain-containing protein [Ignavibacteriaceae bacterium]
MIADDLTALEALGIAIRSEIDAQEVYKDLADLCKNDDLKERFLTLYHEENRHQTLLEKMYNDMFSDIELILPQCQLPKEVNTSLSRKNLAVKDILELAINEERKSREFYLDCASGIKDLSGQRMFRFLADMEFSHQAILNAEYEILLRYPSYFEGQKPWEVESRLKTEKIKRRDS